MSFDKPCFISLRNTTSCFIVFLAVLPWSQQKGWLYAPASVSSVSFWCKPTFPCSGLTSLVRVAVGSACWLLVVPACTVLQSGGCQVSPAATTRHGHAWAEWEEMPVCEERKGTDHKPVPVFFHPSLLEQKPFWTRNANIAPHLGPDCANGLCLCDEYLGSSSRTWASAPRSWKPVPCLTRIHLMKLKSNKISYITQDYYFLPHCVFIL